MRVCAYTPHVSKCVLKTRRWTALPISFRMIFIFCTEMIHQFIPIWIKKCQISRTNFEEKISNRLCFALTNTMCKESISFDISNFVFLAVYLPAFNLCTCVCVCVFIQNVNVKIHDLVYFRWVFQCEICIVKSINLCP